MHMIYRYICVCLCVQRIKTASEVTNISHLFRCFFSMSLNLNKLKNEFK